MIIRKARIAAGFNKLYSEEGVYTRIIGWFLWIWFGYSLILEKEKIEVD
ncbi:MAG: hypothetical protein ABIN25_07750 [Ginsengibacter sp.]